jgi:hypothetical protein
MLRPALIVNIPRERVRAASVAPTVRANHKRPGSKVPLGQKQYSERRDNGRNKANLEGLESQNITVIGHVENNELSFK